MHKTTLLLAGAALCALTPLALAQDEMAAPVPAPELQKLAPLIGNWTGSGKFHEPTGTTNWKAACSYQWSHDKFWVREDFTITFEGMPNPMVFRAYIGWDNENKRYVNAFVANDGRVGLDELHLMPDGSFVQMRVQDQQGMTFAECAAFKFDGKRMTHKIHLLMPSGDAMLMVEGALEQTDAAAPDAMAAGVFMAEPAAEMGKFKAAVGAYDIKGSMTMAPETPAMNISGTETYRTIFGGTVLQSHTDGVAEGMPGKYDADGFWGWDAKRNCYVAVFVSNMGEVGTMEVRFSADGKSLISTGSATMMGVPMLQRIVLDLDDKGAFQRVVGHTLFGAAPPFESFNATYKKK